MSAKAEGEAALAAFDRALAAKPATDGRAFTATTAHLCAMRDVLIVDVRGGGGSAERLGRLNAVISAALAGHFPLGHVPWPELQLAREALAGIVGEVVDG